MNARSSSLALAAALSVLAPAVLAQTQDRVYFISNKTGFDEVWSVGPTGASPTTVTSDRSLKKAVAFGNLPEPYEHDLFGRLRISAPKSLFESTFLYDKRPLLWDELVTVGGTSTLGTSQIDMAVSVASGSRVVRQTKEYFVYQPGRAHLFTGTITFATLTANCNQYVGMLDDNDGVFWGAQGVTFGVGVRTSASGSPSTTFIPRTSFNIDKLDGTGPSGMTIDLTKSQLLQIEYEWYGVGAVRWGIEWNGTLYYVHQVYHANVQAGVYMKRGALPIRYEIANAGAIGAPVTMAQICQNVSSEAGYSLSGIPGAASNGVSFITVGTTLTPLLSIRLSSAYNRATVIPEALNVLGNGADNYEYQLLLNPTLTGASYVSIANSAVEYDTAATVVSGGYLVETGYSSLQTRVISASTIENKLKVVANIAGTTDVLTLAARHLGAGNVPMLASMRWREFK